jgi:hypothetical protein
VLIETLLDCYKDVLVNRGAENAAPLFRDVLAKIGAAPKKAYA